MLSDLRSIKSLSDFKFLYFKYKDSIGFTLGIVLSLVVISIAVFVNIFLPQVNSWFSIQQEITDTRGRIELLEANQKTIAAMDEAIVDRQFALASRALPYEKDYTGYITAIDTATLMSGMSREDYSFSVGNLSTKSAQLSPNTVISLKVTLVGEVDDLLVFLQTLQKILPLSEVVSLSQNLGRVNVEINFFYKYKPENLQIPYTDPVRTLNDKNLELLKTLDDWTKDTGTIAPPLDEQVEASGSAL